MALAKVIPAKGKVPALTAKEALFVEEYLVDFNATQAYGRAGYTPKTYRHAKINSGRLLDSPRVSVAVQQAIERRAKRVRVTADMVVEEFKQVAFSNMKDFATWTGDKVTFKTSGELADEKSAIISEISQTETLRGSQIKLKLHDKIKALEGLAKHLGMFNTKVEVEDPDGKITSITINL